MKYGRFLIGSLRRRTLDRKGWHRRLLPDRQTGRPRTRREPAVRLVVA